MNSLLLLKEKQNKTKQMKNQNFIGDTAIDILEIKTLQGFLNA